MRERSGRQDVPQRSGPKGWRGLLAQRTPPMRAAAKRRSQAELGCGVGPRRGVYGALVGRLTAERRGRSGKETSVLTGGEVIVLEAGLRLFGLTVLSLSK